MKNNMLFLKSRKDNENVRRALPALKCITAAVTASLLVSFQDVQAQIQKVGTAGNAYNLIEIKDGSTRTVQNFSGNGNPFGVWVNNGHFVDTQPIISIEDSVLFQVGGSSRYEGIPLKSPDGLSSGGSIQVNEIHTNTAYVKGAETNVAIAVIGSDKADSIFSAQNFEAVVGSPEYVDIYVDGFNRSAHSTVMNVVTPRIQIEARTKNSFVIQNLGSFTVGEKGKDSILTPLFKFFNDDDSFIIRNNIGASGVHIYGSSFVLINSVEPVKDLREESDRAIIKNSNFNVEKNFFLMGQTRKHGVPLENTFLQIVNDEGVNAEFSAQTLNVFSMTEGNTSTLLLGHGAIVKAPEGVLVSSYEDNSTARLLLGDSLSKDDNYGLQTSEVRMRGPGTSEIIFNNAHQGDSAETASFPIRGKGNVEIQSGRTIFTEKSDYEGVTTIAEKSALILKRLDAAGSSMIINNGELVYSGVQGEIQNDISGSGKVVFDDNSKISLTKDTSWGGGTYLKEAAVSMGSADNPIQINGTYVTVSSGSVLSGFGSIGGSLNNQGIFILGDPALSSSSNFEIRGAVNNSGRILLGNNDNVGNRLIIGGNYSGQNGQLVFNAVLEGDDSQTDKLVVKGDSFGTTFVKVNNIRGTGKKTLNGIELIEVSGDSSGSFIQDGRIVAGAYDYVLKRGSGENYRNWYLVSDISKKDDPVIIPLVRPEAGAYIGNAAVVHTLFSTRLHDRVGDLWFTDPFSDKKETTNFWMKVKGGYSSWKETSGQLKNRTQTYAVQLGSELLSFSSNGNNRFQLGFMGGYGHGRTNAHNVYSDYGAIGSVSGLNFGITGTWYQYGFDRVGAYLDSWLTYSWFDNKIKSQNLVGAKYHAKGLTGSLEAGYTLKLSEFSTMKGLGVGVYLQPQAQVIWSGLRTDTLFESNGSEIKTMGKNNLTTRLGARTIINLKKQENESLSGTQLFVEGNWIHNTKGYGIQMNGESLKQRGSRDLGELKIGVEGRAASQLHLWTNAAARAGSSSYRDLTFMAGMKYSF